MSGACLERVMEKVGPPRALILGIHTAFEEHLAHSVNLARLSLE